MLRQQVLDPLDLGWTTPATRRRIPNLAVGYVGSTWVTRLSRMAGRNMEDGGLRFNPAIEFTGGGLANTPRGLAAFYHGLMQGRLVDPALVSQMIDSAVPSPPLGAGTHYGFGLLIVDRAGFGRYVGHSGWYPGYVSNAAYFADHGFSVAIQMNRDDRVDVYTPIRTIAEGVLEAMGKTHEGTPSSRTPDRR